MSRKSFLIILILFTPLLSMALSNNSLVSNLSTNAQNGTSFLQLTNDTNILKELKETPVQTNNNFILSNTKLSKMSNQTKNLSTYNISNLIHIALKQNRELQELKLDYKKSLLDVKKADATRFPTSDYQISLTHIGNPMKPIYINPADFFSSPVPGVSTESIKVFDGMEDKYYQFKFTLTQPIFTWGKIKNGIQITKLVSQIKELQIKQKEKELKTTVQILVYTLHILNKIEKSISEQQTVSKRLIYLSQKSYESGFLLYSDVLDVKIKVKKLNVATAQIQESKNQALLNLRHTTGLKKLQLQDLTSERLDLQISNYTLPPEKELIQKALKNNLNIQTLKLLTQVASFQHLLAEGGATLKPDIGVRAEFTYGGPRFPLIETDWYGKDDYNLNLSLAFSAKLLDGFKQDTQVSLSKLDLKKADYQYEQGKDKIEQFISETILKLQLNQENLGYFHLKIENDNEQIKSKKTQFEAGSGNETDYLKKKLDQFKDQIDYYKELMDYFKNYFSVLGISN